MTKRVLHFSKARLLIIKDYLLNPDSAMNMSQGHINNNKNKNGADTTASQFFCAVSSYQPSEKFVHRRVIFKKMKM